MASVTYSNAKKYRHLGQEDEEEGEPGESERSTHKQIVKELLHKQLSKHFSVEQQQENQRKFIKSASQEVISGSTSGLASYRDFLSVESRVKAKQVLKSWGLVDSEIQLLIEEDSRKSSLEAPHVRRQRLQAVEEKLAHRVTQFEAANNQTLSRQQESERDLTPHQISLSKQLREIADKLFPSEENQNEGKRRRSGSPDSTDRKREKVDPSCVYLREKPRTYWDMDRVPRIVRDGADYPSVPYPSHSVSESETIIRVTKKVNVKGKDERVIEITRSKKRKDDEDMTVTRVNTETKEDQKEEPAIEKEEKDTRINGNEKTVDTRLKQNKTVTQINRNTETKEDLPIQKEDDTEINENERKDNKNSDTKHKNDKIVTQINRNTKTKEDQKIEEEEGDEQGIQINRNEKKVNKNSDAKPKHNKTIIQVNSNTKTKELVPIEKEEESQINGNERKDNKKTNTKPKQNKIIIQMNKNTAKAYHTKPFILTISEADLIPLATIEANRKTEQELKEMDKFRNYERGTPSRTLYMKNLSPSATPTDLASLMGHFEAPDGTKILYRLMGGRMKGQAFVTFPDTKTASNALELCNGYLLHGKPLVAAFGNKS